MRHRACETKPAAGAGWHYAVWVKLLARLFSLFARPRAARWVVVVSLLLASPALFSPLVIDDHVQQIIVRPDRHYGGFEDPGRSLFSFADGSPTQRAALMEEGLFSWWTDPEFKLSFWRPLSAATHRLDFRLWIDDAVWIHAHSLLWFLLLLVALSRLYKRFHEPKVAVMALALYAIDDARGFVLSVACNRNALIAAVFGVGALIAHDRWRRDGWRPGAALGPLLLVVGLLAGESAVAVLAYLFAYALSVDTGALRERLGRLIPYVVVVVLWQILYGHLGYGADGSGVYVHPLSEPLRFVAKLLERAPVLAAAQFAGPPSDLWVPLPPRLAAGVYVFVLLVLAGVGKLLWPLISEDKVVRFWVLGALLSLIPVSATFTMDRLLVFVGIGASGALACLFERAVRLSPSGGRRWGVVGLVVVHLVLAPICLPARASVAVGMEALFALADESVPDDPSIVNKSLVVVIVPADGAVGYVTTSRAGRGVPRPRNLRMLAQGYGEVQVTRLDARTLRLRAAGGFYQARPEAMVRSPATRSFVGEIISLSNMTVTVTRVNEDGHAAEADFRFASALESPEWLWTQWHEGRLLPWTPPPLGASSVVPSVW